MRQNPFNHEAIKLVALAGMTEHTKNLFGAEYKSKFAIYLARSIFRQLNYSNYYPNAEINGNISVVASRLASDINEVAYFDGDRFVEAVRMFHTTRVKLCIGNATEEEWAALYSSRNDQFENMTDEQKLFLLQLSTNAIAMVAASTPYELADKLRVRD